MFALLNITCLSPLSRCPCPDLAEGAPGNTGGRYSNSFADLRGPLTISDRGEGTTNYVDVGGTTNGLALYYRVRLVP